MSKQIKYILIAIAVLVIVGLGYIFLSENVVNNGNVNNQPTNTNEQPLDNQEPEVITSDIDTSNWQSYRNEELGFEFKYPEDWVLREYKKGEPKGDPTTMNLLIEFYDLSYRLKFFVGVDDESNGNLFPNQATKLIKVNNKIINQLETKTRIHTIFNNDQYLVSFNGVKPLDYSLFNAIIISYRRL